MIRSATILTYCMFAFMTLMSGPAKAFDEPLPNSVDPPKPVPAVSPFPKIPLSVDPVPKPVSPDDVPLITPGTIYIVQDEKPFTLLASPRSVVSIPEVPDEGPMKIRGIFADGNGKIETRTYKSKYICVVDAVEGMTGRVELIFIPDGVTNQTSNLIQRMLIDIGVAPQPPPIPTPPTPQPPESPLAIRFRSAFTGVDAKTDAVKWSAICKGFADYLETTPADLKYGPMKAAWEAALAGAVWPAKKYPNLPAIVREVIPTAVESTPVSDQLKSNIIANLRIIQATADKIASVK